MTLSGWIFFSLFWGLIIGLNVFCYRLILKPKKNS